MKSPYQNYIVSDCETGGLLSKTKRAVFDVAITELAFVVVDSDLEIKEQKSWLIKPYSEQAEYGKGAEIASGISKQMCQEQGIEMSQCFVEVCAFLKRYKVGSSLPVFVGHNCINFDSYFWENFFEYNKSDISKFVNSDLQDTIKWARLKYPESTNYKLGTICEMEGVELTDAHRALSDTVATAKVWINFMKGLRSKAVEKESERFRNKTKFEF